MWGDGRGTLNGDMEMFTAFWTVYAAAALLIAGITLARLPAGRSRRGEYFDGWDRAVLVVVALLSSAVWPIFAPVYLLGWLGSPQARSVGTAVARLGSRLRPHRASHQAAR